MQRNLVIKRLGLTDYRETLVLQQKLQADLINGNGDDTLILCRHKAVITLGRRAVEKNILADSQELNKLHLETIKVERAGDVTLHTPEQLVCYPIINLDRLKKRNVHRYVNSLEETVIKTLSALQIKAIIKEGFPGVWINDHKKISSLGVRISHWCTMHGFAINVLHSDLFRLIIPCGLPNIEMTSIEDEIKRKVDFPIIEELVIKYFLAVYNADFADSGR